MAFSMVISSARPNTTKEDIQRVFGALQLGDLDRIDIVPTTSGNLRAYLHYSSTSTSAEPLRAKLDNNDVRQKNGEVITPIKIVYGRSRDGRDQYWQVYKCKTPAERLAEHTAKNDTFTVRIEM